MRTRFKVELSAYRGDTDEAWRLGRLEDWMSWYAFKVGNPIHCIHSAIHSIHDHKGCLTVTFTQKPTQPMMDCALSAWEEESENLIEFQYVELVERITKINVDLENVEVPDGSSV